MIATQDTLTAAEACRIEHQVLEQIKGALKITLDWRVPEVGLPLKISSVRFTFESFQRHVERLMSFEEDGGYMQVVSEMKPYLCPRADKLREEHDDLRRSISSIVVLTQNVHEDDCDEVEHICDDINHLLRRFDLHDHKEIDLILEVISEDVGGEG